MLEAVKGQGGPTDNCIVYQVFNNMAHSFQQLKDYRNSVKYLDGCLHLLKHKKFFQDSIAGVIRKSKIRAQVHLQMCAMNSLLKKRDLALKHARKAVKYASDVFLKGYSHANNVVLSQTKALSLKNKPKSPKRDSEEHAFLHRIFPVFEHVVNAIWGRKTKKAPLLDTRSVLGVHHKSYIAEGLNISTVMNIRCLNLIDIQITRTLMAELSTDLLVEKVIIM